MMRWLIGTLLATFLLTGCEVGGVPSHIHSALPKCENSDGAANPAPCIINTNSAIVDEIRPADRPPELGLTLSGGGSKAAPFAMGVLKRFVDSGWIFKTDYISSVSGGSYAAYYLYHAAYEMSKSPPAPIPRLPGLTRYFVDTRQYDAPSDGDADGPYVINESPDRVKFADWESLSSTDGGCLDLGANEDATMWPAVGQDAYQGWVECYQDVLRTGRAPLTPASQEFGAQLARGNRLGTTFTLSLVQSLATVPLEVAFNIAFDWKKRVSPTQYVYLYGLMRTYGYMPPDNMILPVSPEGDSFQKEANCLTFEDLSRIYSTAHTDPEKLYGGYLPKWILQATASSGIVAADLSSKHYDQGTAVFEETFDFFGSGRYGYVRGSPTLVGLSVPLAMLSSAAFADSAQRNLTVPRGLVSAGLQLINLRWGFDIANPQVSRTHRILHSFLPFPLYYFDNSYTGELGPTIHLSDGGQSGDNLGMTSMLRRNVRNIIVVSGEQDYEKGNMVLESLCSTNYYLNVRGYTIWFEGNPFDAPRPDDFKRPYQLGLKCTWDGNSHIYVHPVNAPQQNITPFTWKRPVWVGHVAAFRPGPDGAPNRNAIPILPGEKPTTPDTTPQGLVGINIYLIAAAMDMQAWTHTAAELYSKAPQPAGSLFGAGTGVRGNPATCPGTVTTSDGITMSCPLLEYVEEIETDYLVNHIHHRFPQTPTFFTTYDNNIALFEAYRDLGWTYAGTLPDVSPELKRLLEGQQIAPPDGLQDLYDRTHPAKIKSPFAECYGWDG